MTLAPTNATNVNVGSTPDTILTGKGTFGVAAYKATTATITVNNGIKATTSGAGGGAGTTSTTANGFNTIGVRRTPQYMTIVANSMLPPPAPAGQLQASLKATLSQSSQLPSGKNLNVAVESFNNQPVVVLQGTVATEEERRLAENLLRLTPGVRLVKNNIQVQPR